MINEILYQIYVIMAQNKNTGFIISIFKKRGIWQ
jgi:hypothetical protein